MGMLPLSTVGATVSLDLVIVPVRSKRDELLRAFSHGSKAMVRGLFKVALLRTTRSDMTWLLADVARFALLSLNFALVRFLNYLGVPKLTLAAIAATTLVTSSSTSPSTVVTTTWLVLV